MKLRLRLNKSINVPAVCKVTLKNAIGTWVRCNHHIILVEKYDSNYIFGRAKMFQNRIGIEGPYDPSMISDSEEPQPMLYREPGMNLQKITQLEIEDAHRRITSSQSFKRHPEIYNKIMNSFKGI